MARPYLLTHWFVKTISITCYTCIQSSPYVFLFSLLMIVALLIYNLELENSLLDKIAHKNLQ